MARHCIREPRYIPRVHVIGEQSDLFGGPTVSHTAAPRPIGRQALQTITKWAVSLWLGDMEGETILETAAPALPLIYLVACVAAKLDRAAEARDLYISPWLRKARAYVERAGSPWLILSAKHGLIAPSAIVEPYDATLKDMGASARRLWGGRVLDELARVGATSAPLIVLAGRSYRDPFWSSIGHRASAPMEGMGIGEQLAWLSRPA